jgi:hypothetical protein
VTIATLLARLEIDLLKPVVYLGRMTAIARKPDNSALFRLLRRTANWPDEPDSQGLTW